MDNLVSVTAADSSMCYDGSFQNPKKLRNFNHSDIKRRITQNKLAEDLTQRLEKEFGYRRNSNHRREPFNRAKNTSPIHSKIPGMYGNIVLNKTIPKKPAPKNNFISVSTLGESTSERKIAMKFDLSAIRKVGI